MKTIFFIIIYSSSFLFGQVSNDRIFSLAQQPKNYNYSLKIDSIPDNTTENRDTSSNRKIAHPDTSLRSNYCYMTFGLMDILGFGFGHQINSTYAIGIKWTGYWLSGGSFVPNSGAGVGIRLSQYTGWRILNNINYEMTLFYNASTQTADDSKVIIKGGAIDINIGNEKNFDNGINFICSIGIIGSFALGAPPLVLPNIKIGFNINF
jgi:hypothetical protein